MTYHEARGAHSRVRSDQVKPSVGCKSPGRFATVYLGRVDVGGLATGMQRFDAPPLLLRLRGGCS